MGAFGFCLFLGPYIRQLDPPYYELEFPWLGYGGALLGPEELSNIFNGKFETSVVNASWFEDASLTIYISDMWGNWNKNDSIAPWIKVIADGITFSFEENNITIYARVSDWSPIKTVQLIYQENSTTKKIDMMYDENLHLYFIELPPHLKTYLTNYKIYAEDIHGNGYHLEVTVDIEGPIISGVKIWPENPTSKDTVRVTANITDISGVHTVILMYSTNQSSWINITMAFNSTTNLYEANIPPMPTGTTVYFKIYANDTLGNWNISKVYSYRIPKPINIGLIATATIISIVAIAVVVYLIRRRKITY